MGERDKMISNLNMYDFINDDSILVSDAMRIINRNTYGILFLTNNNMLKACITDGDIRRYLLDGGKLSDRAIEAASKNPKAARSIDEARRIYDSRLYIVIPIVDDKGGVVDLFTGDSEITKRAREPINVPVVINAGGKGTRLDPFTRVLPKPLIPVGDMPIIEHIMREYLTYNCDEFHIILNYKRGLMKAYFMDNEINYNITWYDEMEPLGTGGGLSLLRGKLESTFFFANCDALLTADYDGMFRFHKKECNTITMICANKNVSIPYGIVEMNSDGTIKDMKEKPNLSFLTNTGIYIVEPEVIDDIEDSIPVGFPDIVDKERRLGKKIGVYAVNEDDWMDMGQIPELEKMRIKLYGE